MKLSNLQESILVKYFNSNVSRCGGDPKAYDLDALLDRSLSYHENKMMVQPLIDSICGPGKLNAGTIRAYENLAQQHVQSTNPSCTMCGTEYEAKGGVSAGMQQAICEMLCGAGIGNSMERLREREYEEEY